MITSAKAAKINLKTVWIPVIVAGLIYIGWNPIVFILLGGLGGYLYLRRAEKLLDGGKEDEQK